MTATQSLRHLLDDRDIRGTSYPQTRSLQWAHRSSSSSSRSNTSCFSCLSYFFSIFSILAMKSALSLDSFGGSSRIFSLALFILCKSVNWEAYLSVISADMRSYSSPNDYCRQYNHSRQSNNIRIITLGNEGNEEVMQNIAYEHVRCRRKSIDGWLRRSPD